MKTAILFPGQGAQTVGMGKDLVEAYPAAKALFDRASAVLGYDLAQVCFEGPIEKLTQSCYAQPAIFIASLAALAALKQVQPGVQFAAAAGLSSGEWTALHLAGVVSFEDTLKILEVRGRAMQQACEERPGTMMCVIGVDPALLAKVAQEAGVEQANFNSPEQTVLSGTKVGMDAAEAALKAAGVRKAIRLNVAGAFHSSLMASAAQQLEAALAGIAFQAPQLPVVSNVTGQFHTTPDAIRQLMVRQVTGSVQWVQDVQRLQAEGIQAFVECGPGKVLTGLVKRVDKQAALYNISDRSSLEAVAPALAS